MSASAPKKKPVFDPRRAACEVLADMLSPASAERGEDALAEVLAKHADAAGRDRAFMHLLVRVTLRHLGQIDKLLKPCLSKPLPPKTEFVQAALRSGVAQLLWLETPAHAAVHATVDVVKNSRYKGFAGMVNAVLKRIAREGKEALAKTDAARDNLPSWWWDRWCKHWGEEATRRIMAATAQEVPLDICFKQPSDAKTWAADNGGEMLPMSGMVRLKDAGAVTELPGFAEGAWWVQDVAASLPARLLGDVKGKTVLDLCAAPGGKSLQLAAAGAKLVAVDRSALRLKRLKENFARMKLASAVQVVTADMLSWQPTQLAEAILLDAPCSATGTLRRHPDASWRKRLQDITEMTALQATLLDRAVPWLAENAVLIYCVCSLEPEEGECQAAAFLQRHPQMERVPVRAEELGGQKEWITTEGEVRTFPYYLESSGGMDGFFMARFRKKGV